MSQVLDVSLTGELTFLLSPPPSAPSVWLPAEEAEAGPPPPGCPADLEEQLRTCGGTDCSRPPKGLGGHMVRFHCTLSVLEETGH